MEDITNKIAAPMFLPEEERKTQRKCRRAATIECELEAMEGRISAGQAIDIAELREELHERGTKPVIPNRSCRKQPFSFNKRLYKARWLIENAFSRLKDFRRIATRYDRLARNYSQFDPNRPYSPSTNR